MKTQPRCTAVISYERWWLPTHGRMLEKPDNIRVLDMPGDAEFVEELRQGICALPADHEHGANWYCSWHSDADGSCLPVLTLAQLLQNESGC